MCTVVLLKRSGHDWPVMLAANRDERLARQWDPPAPWWPERPGVVAGRDRLGGGTWMGVNRHRVVAVVLNRRGTLGPAPGKRSRGELPLLALESRSAKMAADAIAAVDASAWRSFNMVVADATGAAFHLRGLGAGRPEPMPLADGVHVITSTDPNDMTRARVARHLPQFRAAPAPETDAYDAWCACITDRSGSPEEQLHRMPRDGYGTVCSSVLGLSAQASPVWLFTASSDPADFIQVELGGQELEATAIRRQP